MIVVRRFYDSKLAQASYLIGSTDARSAVVIDPNRDLEQYLRAAAEEEVSITHVAETHIHADFVSGSRELASRVGARPPDLVRGQLITSLGANNGAPAAAMSAMLER